MKLKGIGLLVLMAMGTPAFADDMAEASETYNHDMCIESYSQNCINVVCLTSEDINCPQDCHHMALEKCGGGPDDDSEND